MELDLLKTILNFHKRRKNPEFVIPVLEEHYHASDLTKRAERPVEALSPKGLALFLESLRTGQSPYCYPVALAQFCLGLRIGERGRGLDCTSVS